MRGDLRTNIVRHRAVLAAEATPEDYYDEEKKARRKRTHDLLDGSDPEYKRELAVYQASGNLAAEGHGHDLSGIGTRFTYFYVERPISVESLRQCLIDRDARIEYPRPGALIGVNGEILAPGITRLRVVGGFLDGLDLEFHGGLTTILGTKGTGKSIIVELLRFILGQEPTQPESSTTSTSHRSISFRATFSVRTRSFGWRRVRMSKFASLTPSLTSARINAESAGSGSSSPPSTAGSAPAAHR